MAHIPPLHHSPLSRRGLFKAGGGLGIAALGLGLGAAPASASVPSSKRFDLTQPSYDLFRSRTLHDSTVQQGFAFDNVNRRLFVAQRVDGASETGGDLCITQLDFDGNYVGYMHLLGFGHGVSFGAQGVGSDTYLWTEVEANSNGYGTRLARFKFTNGQTLGTTSSLLSKYAPVSTANEYTCAVDPVNNRLIVRYNVSGDGKHIAVYDLAKASNGDFSGTLADFKQPSLATKSATFQGYTAYGQYLYVMTGDSYDVTNGVVNSEVTSINMNTGAVAQGPVITNAGSTLSFREPEGLAIYQTVDGEVRLFLGFASGVAGDRRSNLFYKNVLV
ncbi:teichoic acid biosynthesis protein C [Streptomyces sp. VRA16 Mangrove soil]|uniref:phage baseplate protein n=1 Tax=Streptomyces sp. VRA16 Mangrove soil TaxID=2817434 RepID=UPI001A9FA80A|nr:teichoic acid biosynthesis protein C [Streptomyces sp. VRA16 Mangrove soil]MBO1333940.1 teichoic acid biosynthesis protein C [Streptomyces sp. VRA16 Mangrove soil]